jgi:hypothetical protein
MSIWRCNVRFGSLERVYLVEAQDHLHAQAKMLGQLLRDGEKPAGISAVAYSFAEPMFLYERSTLP